MNANWKNAQLKAKAIRLQYGNTEPPINAFEIANKAGIAIEYFTPDETTANISGLFEKNTVYLNASDSTERQNFTLAHELGHYFLNHQPNQYGVYWRNQIHIDKPATEQEADCFAAELLMPEDLIRKVKKEYGLTSDEYVTLSSFFGVSAQAMKIRLRDIAHGRTTEPQA